MTLQTLRDHLTYFTETTDQIGMNLYVVLENENGIEELRFADIDAISGAELKQQFLSYLSEKFLVNDELSYLPISQGDQRRNAVFTYDLVERPSDLNIMNMVLENEEQPQFSFRQDDFEKIKAFLITIGNEGRKMVLYKKNYHLNLIRGASSFGIRITDHRFVRVREDILKLSSSIDFLQIGNELVIINLKTLESGFGFESVIRNKATQNIALIAALNLLDDISPLTEMAENLRNAKRIMRIRHDSPVLLLPVRTVVNFVSTYPPIMRKFRLSVDGSRLVLDTLVSKKLFLDIMNDDLLTSELTRLFYTGISKDPLPVDEAEEQ